MPVGALQEGVPWNWRSFDAIPREDRRDARAERRLPRRPLDDPARRHGRTRDQKVEATAGDLAAMQQLLDASLAAGGMGFSSSWARYPQRRRRRHGSVPLRERGRDPRDVRVVREHPGTTLEFIPCVGLFEDFAPDLLTIMSLAANRSDQLERACSSARAARRRPNTTWRRHDYATERGARVLALTVPFTAVAADLLRQWLPPRHDPGLAEADGAPPRREEGNARVRRRPEGARGSRAATDDRVSRCRTGAST